MKIIQSCWSCNQKSLLEFGAGWYSPEYHLMSWALSCLQLKKYYGKVTLYADRVSQTMLIDELNLPYTEIICDLDLLNEYHNDLWALPKIHVYGQQTESFLHVDGDVFIWEPLSSKLMNSGLIAQNMEAATLYYKSALEKLERKLTYFPDEILADKMNSEIIYAYNAGIFGGSDVDFFRVYAEKARLFVNANQEKLAAIDVSTFNIFFEQYLFYVMVQDKKKEVNVLISDIIGDNGYIGLGDFTEVPYNRKYLHLLGSFKKNKFVCGQLANRLREDYPEYYYRIIALFKKNGVSLKMDYQYALQGETENHLTARASSLKKNYRKGNITIVNGSRQRTFLRTASVAETVIQIINDHVNNNVEGNKYETHIADILLFEKKLIKILHDSFSEISAEYLYARDLTQVSYFESIFADKESGYKKCLISEQLFEVVESAFDWSKIYLGDTSKISVLAQAEAAPGKIYTAIVPECCGDGFSLTNIDELDLMLFDLLKTGATVTELLKRLKSAFDPQDVEESLAEFELLITGRIKKALMFKLIRLM